MTTITTTYALQTVTESQVQGALINHGTASSPINCVKVGDIVLSGLGTLTHTYREVTDISTVFGNYGVFYCVTYADGKTHADTANGFWLQVLKMDTDRADAATRLANAYATAWDNRR